jgi:type IV pilus assembly protein PilY1
MITDGESTQDRNIPNNDATHLPNATNLRDYDNDNNDPGSYPSSGSDYLDDICLYGHVNDLRPDTGTGWGNRELGDDQSIECFVVYAFGTSGSQLLMDAARNGGFNDKNGDNYPGPDPTEWDEDGDGIPDNYFQAENGYELEEAIMKAIMEMLARISSASGAAVVSQGGGLGGFTGMGQFFPRKHFPSGELLDWVGNLYTLWLDSLAFIREDTDSDDRLDMFTDRVIKMYFDNDVMCSLFVDLLGNGDSLQYVGSIPLPDIHDVWDGGEWLWNHLPDSRSIYAFVDLNKDGIVDSGEVVDFVSANAAILQTPLRGATIAEADTIIRYVRGEDFPALRTRTADNKVWKLGDIISSTPVAYGPPVERYDYIYYDMEYLDYYLQYQNRRPVLFVGANDGMLHAFNAGLFDPLTGQLDGLGKDLGEELWGYVPYNLLPHLMWLKHLKYCHVYYVDLKPYLSDAKIFPDDAVHPHGWGTVLTGAMRLGGGKIATANDTCQSAYFALDVTDAENPPVPLWEFTDDDMNFTMCYSTLAKVGNQWFSIVTSGAQTCGANCTSTAKVYILELATGQLLRKIELPDPNCFITNIFAVDWNRNYTVDLIYFGTCYEDAGIPGGYGGKIYRINTNSDPDPANWDTLLVMDMQRPITGEGSIAQDPSGHRWVYFGTGRFYSDVDEADITTEHLYVGFRDDTTHSTNPLDLYNVTGIEVDTFENVHLPATGTITFDSLKNAVDNKLGWYRWLDTKPGERSLSTTLVYGGVAFFTTFSPTGDICSYGGQGVLYGLYYLTGTAYKRQIIGTEADRNKYYIELGPGVPSEPALYLNKVILQTSGELVEYEYEAPEMPREGVIIWKGK